MTKGLKALERIVATLAVCKKIYLNESAVEEIEKELKALEIIKKHCEFGKTIPLPNMKTYYDLLVNELTQEEYDLLKEVML